MEVIASIKSLRSLLNNAIHFFLTTEILEFYELCRTMYLRSGLLSRIAANRDEKMLRLYNIFDDLCQMLRDGVYNVNLISIHLLRAKILLGLYPV